MNRSGHASLFLKLKKLGTSKTVLHVGAHPDDEEIGLLSYIAYKHYGRAVYWSATRGESGQNRINKYQRDALGVYRTWESLLARDDDGGECLFGPFVDFGFSKKVNELTGLTANDSRWSGPANFELRRDAGTIRFNGRFEEGWGEGTYRFDGNLVGTDGVVRLVHGSQHTMEQTMTSPSLSRTSVLARLGRHPALMALAAALLIVVAAFVPALWQALRGLQGAESHAARSAPWESDVTADGAVRALGLRVPGANTV